MPFSPWTPPIQTLLDVWPRDLHLFQPFAGSDEGAGAGSGSFAESLQAHFRSTLLQALMTEVRARLAEGSSSPGAATGAPSAYLSTAAYKLAHNLPRLFGLAAANTFLARCVDCLGLRQQAGDADAR